MKSFVFLTVLVLITACAPHNLPTTEPLPTLIVTTKRAPTAFSSPATTATPLLPSPTPIFDVIIDNVAIGAGGQLYASGFGVYGDNTRYFARWDGDKWIPLGNGFQTAGNALAVDSAGRLYTEILKESEGGAGTAIMRWEGGGWEDISRNFSSAVDALNAGRISSNIPVAALAMDGEDNLYAAGSFYYPSADHTNEFPMGYVAKWNQETWTILGQGFDKVNIAALAVSVTGQVYVSGEQPLTSEGNSSYVAQWDGETWTQIQRSPGNAGRTIALDKSGRLYASFPKSTYGEVVACWDGTDWITISDSLEGEAPFLSDIAVGANGYLTIGGSFESVSGVSARNLAYWDGSSWHALAQGVDRSVNALAFAPNGDLYAVGAFTQAGGLPAPHAARWDGEMWHALTP